MITENEVTATQLSATKKDFVQIWNELLDTASKISERWDPTSTNESDPGIVLLKVLTGIADKLNYTIDKNTLEAFMPSAAQQESMRKLCDMMGYSIKYYQSATTDITISYDTSKEALPGTILINKFTNIKDEEDTINYVTLHDIRLDPNNTSKTVSAIEGELVEVETDEDNVVTLIQLDDNRRYFLPESQVAENGIFITNVADGQESAEWTITDNLNIHAIGTRVFKLGYDSKQGLPYIQFPNDIATLIEDGLRIKYIRTNGSNGNISAKILKTMSKPTAWDAIDSEYSDKDYFNNENYTVVNYSAATNGREAETINEAYDNYKKTIGTFDTLVTCRDYMNKIYQMMTDDNVQDPLVSNIIVSDIRDDINKATTLCTFNEYGICYKNISKQNLPNPDFTQTTAPTADASNENKVWLNTNITTDHPNYTYSRCLQDTNTATYAWTLLDLSKSPTDADLDQVFAVYNGSVPTSYRKCIIDGSSYKWEEVSTHAIDHFDLVLYPFRTVTGNNNYAEYTKSFMYDTANLSEITSNLEDCKLLSHNIVSPEMSEIACVKNYIQLKAKITTVRKVNTAEELDILSNVYTAIYKNFNMRQLDFGSTLTVDKIKEVIQDADPRIKDAPIEEPTYTTKFCTVDGNEYECNPDSTDTSTEAKNGNIYYNRMALNNILAGRISMFNYNTDFTTEFNEKEYGAWSASSAVSQVAGSYNTIYGANNEFTVAEPRFEIYSTDSNMTVQDIKLQDNEVVQFRLPNLKTTETFAAYVNYFIHLNADSSDIQAIPATMQTVSDFLDDDSAYVLLTAVPTDWATNYNKLYYTYDSATCNYSLVTGTTAPTFKTNTYYQLGTISTKTYKLWEYFANKLKDYVKVITINSESDYTNALATRHQLFTKNSTTNNYERSTKYSINSIYYYLDFNKDNYVLINNLIKQHIGLNNENLNGLYISTSTDASRVPGYLVDINGRRFVEASTWQSSTDAYINYFVQKTHADSNLTADDVADRYIASGLGQAAVSSGISENEEYRLKTGEYLLINYTKSADDDSEVKTRVNRVFTAGTIIRPNFQLIDSLTKRDSTGYEKTKDFNFGTAYDIAGMFTLGSNEQIEIRQKDETILNTTTCSLYWERNDEDALMDDNGKITFEFDEDYDSTSGKYLTYILKDGEYFYYTDANKQDLKYWGSGTRITRSVNTPDIYKYKLDSSTTAEDIENKGLSASIPWRTFNFYGGTNNVNKKAVTITPHQYLSLVKDNVLNSISSSTVNPEKIELQLDNTWKSLSSGGAIYTIDGTEYSLPKVDLGDNSGWEVRTKLEMNVSSDTAQTLHVIADTDTPTQVFARDTITFKKAIYNIAGEISYQTVVTISPKLFGSTTAGLTWCPLSFKTNMEVQDSRDAIDLTINTYDANGNITETLTPLAIKLFELTDATKNINIDNFGNGNYTKLAFSSIPQDGTNPDLSINAIINSTGDDPDFGLMMIYYTDEDPSGLDNAYITFTDATDDIKPELFNINTGNTSLFDTDNNWWLGLVSDDKYYLRKGVNIIKIAKTATINIFSDSNRTGTVIASKIDSIKVNTPLNYKLDYRVITTSAGDTDNLKKYNQLLHDINMLDTDHQFYYNLIPETNSTIDLNAYDTEELLSSPAAWYDYNNYNNKFVISEIDASVLSNTVTIAKASKL